MKRLFTTIFAWLAVVCMMAQGWPENYGGVMLQGFYWDYYDDSDWGTWSRMETQADDLKGYIDLIWVPNSARTKNDYCVENGLLKDMGYMPCYWLDHDNTIFGSSAELKSMIKTYKEKGIGIIEDVVINHKNGLTNWCDFPNEEVTGGGKTYSLTWSLADICQNDNHGATKQNNYEVTGADDTGDDFDGCRDLDHTSEHVQQNVKTYLDYLKNELGYVGFRYDMVKGYGAQYVGIYNKYANPEFSVGEYWDDWDGVTNWIDGTKQDGVIQSAAFDFPLKFLINQAFKGDFDGSKLATQGMAGSKDYQRYSVTFVDNHDTYRDGNCMNNSSHVLAANAFILAMPGTPCIFLPHWKLHKKSLKKMIAARKAAGITNQSSFEKVEGLTGGIGFKVTGTKGSVLITLGYVTAGVPEGYKIVVSGDAVNHDFCYYVNDALEVPAVEEEEDNTIQKNIRIYLEQTDNILDYSLYIWNSANEELTGAWNANTQKISYLLNNATSKNTFPAGTTYVKDKAWYYITIPNQEEINLILHNNGTTKTQDIKNITSDIFLSYTGGTDYTNETSSYAGYGNNWVEQGEICAFFVDNDGTEWGDIHAWAWSGEGDATVNYTGGKWPGIACQYIGLNEKGEKIYKWTYTGNLATAPESIIFNNNNSIQTADCTFTNGGWYDSRNKKDGNASTTAGSSVPASDNISVPALGTPTSATNWNGVVENVAGRSNSENISKAFTLNAGSYIVQAIVRGTQDGTVTLTANEQNASATLTGLDGAASTVQTNGAVESYVAGTNNGWQKAEVAFTLTEATKVTVQLTSAAETWQLGALKVLPSTTKTKATSTVKDAYVDATSGDYSFYERGANPNALIKATAKTIPAQLPYNVIVGSTCENLVLTDGAYDFNNSGSDFTATSVSYDRSFTVGEGNRSTVCLPFALDASEVALAGKFWELDSYNAETGHIKFKEVVTTEANTPYIFEAKTAQPFLVLSEKKVPASSLVPVTKDGISFLGVNARQNLMSTGTETYYGYHDNAFVKVGSTNGANINPFRAYLTTTTNAPARISVSFDGEEGNITGIEYVTPAVKPMQEQPVYNLNGQRMKTPNKKGLYIIGGQKYIVK